MDYLSNWLTSLGPLSPWSLRLLDTLALFLKIGMLLLLGRFVVFNGSVNVRKRAQAMAAAGEFSRAQAEKLLGKDYAVPTVGKEQ